MSGALAQLPDATSLIRLAATASADADVVVTGYRGLAQGDAGSPLAPLAAAVGSVAEKAQLDLDGLATELSRSLGTLQSGLPPAALEFVTQLEDTYRGATNGLAGHPLLDLVPEGGALRDIGLQVIDEAVDLFGRRVTDLAASVIDTQGLRAVTAALQLMERLRDDLPAHVEELPEFVATALFGFHPAVLGPLRAHLSATADAVAALDDRALASALTPLRTAGTEAMAAMTAAVAALDPAVTAGYDAVVAALDGTATASEQALDVLTGLYDGTVQRVTTHAWDHLLPVYLDLLGDVDLTPQLSVDSVLDATTELLDDLVAAAQRAVAADELVDRVEAFAAGVRAAVAGSGIGQLRKVLIDVFGDIRDAVAAVPLEAARQAVVDLLERVGRELGRLDLDAAAGQIKRALGELEARAVAVVAEAGGAVQEALDVVLDAVESLPIEELVTAIRSALPAVDGVITTVQTGAAGYLDALESQLAALETVSFRPVGDEVVDEIDEIRARLAAMSPNALSPEEQLAVRAAIAVFEAIDLEGTIATELTAAFRSLQSGVLRVLDDVAAALERLRQVFAELDPDRLVEPVTGSMARIRGELDRLDAPNLLAPARAEVDRLNASVARLAPSTLLTPLDAPYDAVVAAIGRLDPAVWGASLVELHADLVALVDRIDLGPLFAELDERRRGLLATTREALAQGVQALELPAPLDAWFSRVRLLLEEVTDLLFSDPGEGMRQLGFRVAVEFKPSSLYEPLDAAFDEVVATLDAIPDADLVAAATALRDDLLAALELLEPARLQARLRAAHRRLAEATAASVLPAASALTTARATFRAKVDVAVSTPSGEVARVSARFDAVFAMLESGRGGSIAANLVRRHDEALEALRQAVDAVDVTAAQREWTRLRAQLDRLVPAELLAPEPLTATRVIAACETWRPSARSSAVDERLETFLTTLGPLAQRLDLAFLRFAEELRTAAELLDPLALDQAVIEIIDALRDQLAALAPGPVLGVLRDEVWQPVAEAVTALDPAVLAQQLDAAYASASRAVARELDALMDRVERAVGDHLGRARSAAGAVLGDLERVVGDSTSTISELVERVDRLVFVEVLTRLRAVIVNLGTSFDAELARVRKAFDAMLEAAPVGQPRRPATAGVGT